MYVFYYDVNKKISQFYGNVYQDAEGDGSIFRNSSKNITHIFPDTVGYNVFTREFGTFIWKNEKIRRIDLTQISESEGEHYNKKIRLTPLK